MSQVCRTCLEVYENGCQLFSLEINEPMFDRIHIKTKLEACVPEIALHRVRNSVICRYCLFALNTAYDFKTKCLQTETRIYNCMTSETIDSNDLSRFVKRNTNNIFNCDMINQNSRMNGESRILLSPLSLLPPPPVPPQFPTVPPLPPLSTLSAQASLSSVQPLSARPALLSRSSLQGGPPQQTDSLFQAQPPFLEGPPRPTSTLFPPSPAGLYLPPAPRLQPRSTSQSGQALSEYSPVPANSRLQVEHRLHQVGPPFSEGSRAQIGPPFSECSSLTGSSQLQIGRPFSEGSARFQIGPPLPAGLRLQMRPSFSEGSSLSPISRFQVGPPFHGGSSLRLQVRPTFPEGSTLGAGSRLQMRSPLRSMLQCPPRPAGSLFQGGPPSSEDSRLQANAAVLEGLLEPTGPQLHAGNSILNGSSSAAGSLFQRGGGVAGLQLQVRPALPEGPPLSAGSLFQGRSPLLDGLTGQQLQVRPQLPEGPPLPAGSLFQDDPRGLPGQELQVRPQLSEGLLPEGSLFQGRLLLLNDQSGLGGPSLLQVRPPLPEGQQLEAEGSLQSVSPSQSPDSPLLTLPASPSLPTGPPLAFPSFSCSFNTSPPPLAYRLSANGGNAFMLPDNSINPSYTCSICQQCFTSYNILKEHMNCHINPDGLKCSMCSFQTNSTVCLDEHLKAHGRFAPMDTSTPTSTGTPFTDSSYKCFNCNYSTTDRNLFKEHRATHVAEAVHQCGLCNFRSTHSSSLRRHMKVHMGDRPYRCTECRYGAGDETSLQVHMKIHKKERPHKCSDCPFSALKRSKLKIHMSRSHGKVFESNQENEDPSSGGSPTVDPYQVSIDDIHNILQAEDDSSDPQCGTPDGVKEAAGPESERIQDVDPYMITIEDIQKILHSRDENDNENNEALHTETESGRIQSNGDSNNGKVFRCSTCKQQFNYIYLLRRHMAIHSSNNKPLECSKCDFRTTIKSHLQVHMKTHTGGKVYTCEKCEYSTIYWSNIQKHHRVHTGEKPFKCSVCDYRASQQTTLKSHMNTHAESAVYKCSECSYSTNTEEGLLTHIEMHSIGGHFLEDGISNNFIEDSIRRHFALNNISNNLIQDVPDDNPVPESSKPSEDVSPEGLANDSVQEASTVNFTQGSNTSNDFISESSLNNCVQEPSSDDVIQEPSSDDVIQESPNTDDDFIPELLQNGFVQENNFFHESPNLNDDIITETHNNDVILETPDNSFIIDVSNPSSNFVQEAPNNFIHESPNLNDDIITETHNNGVILEAPDNSFSSNIALEALTTDVISGSCKNTNNHLVESIVSDHIVTNGLVSQEGTT